MSVYKCSLCGYTHDETKSGPFSELEACSVCLQPAEVFVLVEENPAADTVSEPVKTEEPEKQPALDLNFDRPCS